MYKPYNRGRRKRGTIMSLLKVENVSKIYGKGETQVKALDDVSFSVESGEFVAIIGPSGSGKSTLLHILGCVDNASLGKVYIDGVDVSSLKDEQQTIFRRRHIGLIYQFYNLIPILNVKENIQIPVELDGGAIDQVYYHELLETLDLKSREKHLPKQLSGGQQQRVSIGRALMNRPSIILADEPTGNLDQTNSRQIIELLKEMNESYGQTVLMITHDEDIAMIANRIIVIEDGKIVKDVKNR